MAFLENYDFPELEGEIPGDIFLGVQGKPGATFIPTVDEDGNLSWSNNGNLENPKPVNIRGKPFTYADFTAEQLATLKGEEGGYYTPTVSQPDANIMRIRFAASQSGMPSVAAKDITLPAGKDYVLTDADKTEIAEMAADMVEVPEGSGGNVAYDEAQNLTDEQKAQARENIGAQPAGNYLTEVPEGYAKTGDIPTDAEIIQLIKDNTPESSGGGIVVTGAKVGQTVKIAEVDENGVPTAWLPADFPSGGASEDWERITVIDLTEEVSGIAISTDANGLPFSLKKMYIHFYHPKYEGSSDLPNYAWTEINNKRTNLYTSFTPAPSKSYYRVLTLEIEIKGEGFVQYITGSRDNVGGEEMASGPSQVYYRSLQESYKEINSIKIYPNTGILGCVGTHIVVYGVRA